MKEYFANYDNFFFNTMMLEEGAAFL